jgi:hypothetical protein
MYTDATILVIVPRMAADPVHMKNWILDQYSTERWNIHSDFQRDITTQISEPYATELYETPDGTVGVLVYKKANGYYTVNAYPLVVARPEARRLERTHTRRGSAPSSCCSGACRPPVRRRAPGGE